MDWPQEILDKLKALEEKYGSTGQDMSSYLEGLIHMDYAKYWDYIQLDVLLNLQIPKTTFEDEYIFITYHQITELYFKLILQAIDGITSAEEHSVEQFLKFLKRINRYLKSTIDSFEIMVEGLDKDQFLKFRMSLLPASGFQSAQYRLIEIASTPARNLVANSEREKLKSESNIDKLYENFYWKRGGIELKSGKKTLTLKHFEEKYTDLFIRKLNEYEHSNLWECYKKLSPSDQANEELIQQLRLLDLNLEVYWPLSHYRSAVKHLQKDPMDIAATGGTNWQKYLPPKFQGIQLFPELWDKSETKDWGRKKELAK